MGNPSFTIGAVERETGLSKDVLRAWERRYGFPVPERDANGERIYSNDQVERLRLLKRLVDQGYRPGKLVPMPAAQLQALAPRRQQVWVVSRPDATTLEKVLDMVRQHDADGFVRELQQRLARDGLRAFVLDTVAPLVSEVGRAWELGRLQIFEEHLFSELSKRLLRQAIAALPRSAGNPRVLMTSVPNEQHVLGLLMVEALLALDGAHCIAFGAEMPLGDIARAARAHRADVVALSFSQAFAARHIPEVLGQLRVLLPPQVALWVGGAGVRRAVIPDGVLRLDGLEAGEQALAAWRARAG